MSLDTSGQSGVTVYVVKTTVVPVPEGVRAVHRRLTVRVIVWLAVETGPVRTATRRLEFELCAPDKEDFR